MTEPEDPPGKNVFKLLSHHAALLAASAISPAVAEARGYRSLTIKAEARRLGFSDRQTRIPALLIPVWGVGGEIATYQARPDEPRMSGRGRPIKYETPAGSRMALDVHPAVRARLGDPQIPLFITEGIRKGDAAVTAGLCCIALLGVWNWRGTNDEGGKVALSDFELIALRGRDVYLAFDSDVATKPEVRLALERLRNFLAGRGAHVRVIRLPAAAGGAKTGLDDYLAAGHTVDDLLALVGDATLPDEDRFIDRPDGDGRSQAARLVELAEGVELFHTSAGEPFATIDYGSHRRTHGVRSSGFKGWLRRQYWAAYRQPPTAGPLSDALETLAARAEFEGETRPVAVRLAEHEGSLFLDLANDAWQVVEIGPDHWRVVSDPPVRFRRSATMAPLPLPARGGSMELLRPFVNVDGEDGWHLFVGALVAAFRARGSHFVLVLHGEQGSAKSTSARIFRALIDPSRSALRGEPARADDLLIAALNNWIVAFDNLSHLQPWLSDALCRLSTGGGLGKRQLYTDADEVVLEARRPLILNGITELATRGDLLDRAIVIEQTAIPDTARRSETELWASFETARPQILGALLGAVSSALANEKAVVLDRLPRMADPARWITAAEPALGWAPGSFLASYDRNRHESDALVLEASILAGPLRELAGKADWQGPAAALLAVLAAIAGDDVTHQRAWPTNPTALTGALKRLAPSLRAQGIEWKRLRRSGSSRPHSIRIIGGKTDMTVMPVIPSIAAADRSAQSVSVTRHAEARTVTPDRSQHDGDDARDGPGLTLFGTDQAAWSVGHPTSPANWTLDDDYVLGTA